VIELAVADAVATITLARADARNAIDPAWVAALAGVVERVRERISEREDIRCVLTRARGPAFSVGGDLGHFAAQIDDLSGELDAMTTPYHETLRVLAELPVPVVAAAHGAIAGGGLGLLWAADVVLVADDAKLATGFAKLGLSGDGGSSWYLPRLLGVRRATQLIMGGRILTGAEAVDWGLADRALPAAELEAAGRRTAVELAAGPTVAFGEMRRLVRTAFDRGLADGLRAETSALARCGATADGREGILAFVQRRPPSFEAT
jgi:2-(1,2-epoxy-1,2-dihydrophenyl)acetyl-CoA isomerase